jgi:phosphoadenosine phosphosulfate reductase
MKSKYINQLNESIKDYNLRQTLEFFYNKFNKRVVIASSMSVEDQIILNEAMKVNPNFNIFTIDTGRLPQETYNLIDRTNKFYGINIKIYFPDYKKVEKMINENGVNLFYESIEKRQLCCYVRKVEPLKRALRGVKVWITGLRREQSITRRSLEKVEWDENYNIIKLNPLIDWTEKMIWDYVKTEKIPYNELHDKNYPSIGCEPCTRPVKIGEDVRAGRWWWENPEQRECGIHIKDGKVIRLRKE